MLVSRSRRALLVLVSAALAVVAVPAGAAPAVTPRLIGSVEAAALVSTTHVLTVSGWVEDLTQTASSPTVGLWIDGRYLRAVAVDLNRPDVNAARKVTGKHGFRLTLRWGVAARTITIRTPDQIHRVISSRTITQVRPVVPVGTRIITEARKYLGTNHPGYVFGGTSPVSGFDCSGYTQYVYRQAKVASLPRTAEQQRHAVRLIPRSQARPGDLVFYLSGASAYHEAIYAGNGMQYAAATPEDGIRYQGVWSADVQYGTTWH